MKKELQSGHMNDEKKVQGGNQEPAKTASELLIDGLMKNESRRDLSYEIQKEKLETKEIVSVSSRTLNGQDVTYLTTEPTMFQQLSKKCRLSSTEYVKAIHRFLQEEQSIWDDNTMQDMISKTSEYIIAETMIKYAEDNNLVEITDEMKDHYTIQFSKRYEEGKKLVGSAIIISLMQPIGL